MKDWNQIFKDRTKKLALSVIKLYGKLPKNDEVRILGKQLLRSCTSVAANYRASIVARSDRERFSKLSIVVEEADESLFWLELLEESGLAKNEDIAPLKIEAEEILRVMSAYRKKYKG